MMMENDIFFKNLHTSHLQNPLSYIFIIRIYAFSYACKRANTSSIPDVVETLNLYFLLNNRKQSNISSYFTFLEISKSSSSFFNLKMKGLFFLFLHQKLQKRLFLSPFLLKNIISANVLWTSTENSLASLLPYLKFKAANISPSVVIPTPPFFFLEGFSCEFFPKVVFQYVLFPRFLGLFNFS